MKCDENGGCPFQGYGMQEGKDEMCVHGFHDMSSTQMPDCHITSTSFPIIRAILAGAKVSQQQAVDHGVITDIWVVSMKHNPCPTCGDEPDPKWIHTCPACGMAFEGKPFIPGKGRSM